MKLLDNKLNYLVITVIGTSFLFFAPIKSMMSPEAKKRLQLIMAKKLVQKKMIQAQQKILVGHTHTGTAACISKNGQVVATADEGNDNNLILWDGITGQKIKEITITQGPITNLEMNHDGSKVVIITEKSIDKLETNDYILEKFDSTIMLWDTKSDKDIEVLNVPQGLSTAYFNADGTKIILEIDKNYKITVINADNFYLNEILPSTEHSRVYIIDAITDSVIKTHTHTLKNIYQDAITILDPQGKSFILTSENRLYNLKTGTRIKQLEGPEPDTKIYSASYSGDGTKIIYHDQEQKKVFIWNAKTGKLSKRLNNININSAILNYDGTKILIARSSDQLSLANLTTKKIEQTFKGNQTSTTALALTPDSKIAFSAGDQDIIAWDTQTGEQIHTLNHANANELTISPDGKLLLSHSSPAENEKCTMILWDIKSGKMIHTFVDLHERFSASADLRTLVSIDTKNDHNFILWTPLGSK